MASLVIDAVAARADQYQASPSVGGSASDATSRSRPSFGRPDAYFVKRARGGDAEAFTTLMERHRPGIGRLVRSLVANVDDAADIEQEVFIKAYTSLGELSSPDRFRPWVTMIARHACTDYIRKSARDGTVSLDTPVLIHGEPCQRQVPDITMEPAAAVQLKQLKRDIGRAVNSLSAMSRRAFLMREHEGMSMKQIADRIDGSIGCAKSLIYRARRKIEEYLQPHLAA